MSEKLEGRARELLEQPNLCFVGTTRKDGTVQVVPTWVDVEEGRPALNTSEGRAWPANARRDGKITLTVADTENPYEFVTITGTLAEDTHDGALEQADRLAKKYMGVDKYPFLQPGEQRITFRIEPERIFHQSGG